MSKRTKTVPVNQLKAARRRLASTPFIGRLRQYNTLNGQPLPDKRLEGLLLYYRGLGYSLEMCADPRRLGKTLSELQKLCDTLKVAFPDYRPKRKVKAKAKAKTPAAKRRSFKR